MLLQQEAKVWELLTAAAAAGVWNSSGRQEVGPSTLFPDVSSTLELSRILAVEAARRSKTEGLREGFGLLDAFHTATRRWADDGALIHYLVHIAGRKLQQPLLTHWADTASEADLVLLLDGLKKNYANRPSVTALLQGEFYFGLGAIEEIFAGVPNDEDVKAEREALLKKLQAAGIDSKQIARMEEQQLFSVAKWKEQARAAHAAMFAELTNGLAACAPRDLDRFDADFTKRFASTVPTLTEPDAAITMWRGFLLTDDTPSFEVIQDMHQNIGAALVKAFLSVITPSLAGVGKSYWDWVATERLLLHRVAQRLSRGVEAHLPLDVRVDPWSGKSFQRSEDPAVGFYSFGRDGDDDEGIPWNRKTDNGDLLLVTPSP